MSRLNIVAKIVAKRESLEQVKRELFKMIVPTREEPGCIEYRLHQDNDDPAVFVFYETWESVESFKQHTASGHYKHYIAAVDGLIADKTVHKMTELGN